MKKLTKFIASTAMLAATVTASTSAMAKPLKLYDDLTEITIQTEEGPLKITRERTEMAKITGILQPVDAIEGVKIVGEIDVLKALQNPDEWVILDHREPKHYFGNGHVPNAIMLEFGVAEQEAHKYADKKIISMCYGANCPKAIWGMKNLIKGGIKPEQIHYYRGGTVSWSVMGLPLIYK